MSETIEVDCPNCAGDVSVDVSDAAVDGSEPTPWRLLSSAVSCERCKTEVELMFYERSVSDATPG